MPIFVVFKVNRRFATWFFDGFTTPALDVRFDETPPTHRGSVPIPGSTSTSALGTSVFNEYEEIQAFYQDQGITAHDVLRMTAADALARVPVETIRARTFADVPDPEGDSQDSSTAVNESLRGVVTKLSVVRTVDNSVVPAVL
ncbi:MAG: hypothetical protein CL819_08995 [Croceicoccus sp.]|nr:hypothetical protein [Croceicoccus sp.]